MRIELNASHYSRRFKLGVFTMVALATELLHTRKGWLDAYAWRATPDSHIRFYGLTLVGLTVQLSITNDRTKE